MNKKIDKSLDGVYGFMADVYQGNWQYRFGGVPWMEKNARLGKRESISAHQWACMGFWFTIKDVCPALSSLVDTASIYERVWSHDIGETFLGDVSQYLQLKGKGKNKDAIELKEVERMSRRLPKKTQQRLSLYLRNYDKEIEKVSDLELLIAKLMDVMQGNHFGLVFGKDLPKHGEAVKKILERTFVKISSRLLEVLKQKKEGKAYNEVLYIVEHHLKYYKKLGINIDHPYSK